MIILMFTTFLSTPSNGFNLLKIRFRNLPAPFTDLSKQEKKVYPYLKSLRLQKKLDPLARTQWALKVGISENKRPLFCKRIFFKSGYIRKRGDP